MNWLDHLVYARSFRGYMEFYYDYVIDKWNQMGPTGYLILLLSVCLVGWMMMKSGIKRC